MNDLYLFNKEQSDKCQVLSGFYNIRNLCRSIGKSKDRRCFRILNNTRDPWYIERGILLKRKLE